MATEKEARVRGYVFTGIYDWDKEKVKARQKEFAGYKTLLVNVSPSKLSRGHHGMGYSVYIEPRYERDQRVARLKAIVASEEDRLRKAKADYDNAVFEIKAETAAVRAQINDLEGGNDDLHQN